MRIGSFCTSQKSTAWFPRACLFCLESP
uniref:Uncharacterized protein n=1 Tax=Anguilla anguilla TaxID=7936 RepID=A0A0E9V8F0_ANGAN